MGRRTKVGGRVEVLDRGRWIVTVDEVLSAEECRALVDEAESTGFEAAPITTAAGFVHNTRVRNNGRVMRDDPDRAAWLWERMRDHAPAKRDGLRAVGLNERLRVYRYEPGQYFRWHFDGAFVRDEREESLLTLMVYLNGDFMGGETEFDQVGRVVPETGKALLFQHHVLHQGAAVLEGCKYVLRTDVMYRLDC